MKIKIGHSYDVHQLVENRNLILGGIDLQYKKGLLGHSDADVLLHAITESIIGALGKGDIGTLFPDTDDRFKNIDSMLMLNEVLKIMENDGYKINNIDATVYLENPKLNPHINNIVDNITRKSIITKEQINIKATRGEEMGFIGRGEGIAAEAIVLISNND